MSTGIEFAWSRHIKHFSLKSILKRPASIPSLKNDNIDYTEDLELESVDSNIEDGLKLVFKQNKSNSCDIFCDYLLFAIGRKPLDIVLDEELSIVKDKFCDDKRLFFIGDVVNKGYRQVSIASGDGIKAAMQIYDDIRGELTT